MFLKTAVLASVLLSSSVMADTYILSAAPRDEGDAALFEPIAQYLSQATGARIVYESSDNWLTYQSKMLSRHYDLLLDGPHFVSWRIDRQHNTALVRLPQDHVWKIVVKADSPIKDVAGLIGKAVCVHAAPNFGTLTLESHFQNPARQPWEREIKGWKAAFDGVQTGKCLGTILPESNLAKLDPDGTQMKVIFTERAFPNQAITASDRMPLDLQRKIADALLAPEGQKVTEPLRKIYGNGTGFVRATNEEYAKVDVVLRNHRGFEF